VVETVEVVAAIAEAVAVEAEVETKK